MNDALLKILHYTNRTCDIRLHVSGPPASTSQWSSLDSQLLVIHSIIGESVGEAPPPSPLVHTSTTSSSQIKQRKNQETKTRATEHIPYKTDFRLNFESFTLKRHNLYFIIFLGLIELNSLVIIHAISSIHTSFSLNHCSGSLYNHFSCKCFPTFNNS